MLKEKGLATGLGDEGGFAPDLPPTRPRSTSSPRRSSKAGSRSARDIALALDVAATEFHDDGAYNSRARHEVADEMIAYYAELVDAYPIVSIEDPLAEDDWDGWMR